ncbi:hypothetical protein D3C81_868870 [compost metagenome]
MQQGRQQALDDQQGRGDVAADNGFDLLLVIVEKVVAGAKSTLFPDPQVVDQGVQSLFSHRLLQLLCGLPGMGQVGRNPLDLHSGLSVEPLRLAARHTDQGVARLSQALDQRLAQAFAGTYHHGSHRLSPDVACCLRRTCQQNDEGLAKRRLYPDV